MYQTLFNHLESSELLVITFINIMCPFPNKALSVYSISLLPIILLTNSDGASDDTNIIDASQYLSEYAQITLETTTDGE